MKQRVWSVIATINIMFVACTAVLANTNGLQPIDIFDIRYARDVQIAPDASRIVYVRITPDIITDRSYRHLWMINADGTEHYPLTQGKHQDLSPRWSPDGNQLAYISTQSGTAQVYVRSLKSHETRRIGNINGSPQGLTWSPDGSQLAFTMLVPVEELQIGDMPVPPEGAKWAPPVKYTNRMTFQRDVVGDLPRGFTQIFLMSLKDNSVKQVTDGPYHFAMDGYAGVNTSIAWSGDGKSLIVPANLRDDAELEIWDTEIYEIRLGKGEVLKESLQQLTNRHGPDANPIVSPNGKLIAFLGYNENYIGHQNFSLYVMNRNGKQLRQIKTGIDSSITDIQWASDSKGIYGLYDHQGNTQLALFNLTGGSTVLANNIGTRGFNYGAGYGAGSFSVANNGTYAITLSTPTIVGDLAVGRNNSDTRRLTNLNAALFKKRQLGNVEPIWWQSSKDGRRIQGWIIKPPNFNPNRSYPLVLELHGGPYANYGPRFDTEKQLLAGAGYVVLYANPRGSTSYGSEFANLIQHNYPGDEFYDLESGVDAVIEKGFIDKNRLYITGGSGGGVLTTWMIGHTNRYRAAVAFYPVINWTSFVLTADVSPYVAKHWFPGMPWDYPQHYQKRSPLSLVKNVKTPTLIMTGDQDWRTPMSESEQYFKALKLQGVETVLARVPGEGHAILGRPSYTMAKSVAVLGWFKAH